MGLREHKPEMTKGQKRLLWLVYIMGVVLVGLFIFIGTVILWRLVHLH